MHSISTGTMLRFMALLLGLVALYYLRDILIALLFDFTNGAHDAANSIATVVSTRVLSPRSAVMMAAFFNFVAFAVFGVAVAATIAKGEIGRAHV